MDELIHSKGPAVRGRCTVCRHPQVIVIDDLLRARKRSYRKLAEQFDLGEKALARHLEAHVDGRDARQVAPRRPTGDQEGRSAPGEPLASPADPEVATVDPADVLKRQLAYLDGLDLGGLSPSQRVDVLESRRRTADSLARLDPPAANLAVTVNDVDGLPQLIARFHEALKPWPEARRALAQVWRESRGAKLADEEA